MNFILLYVLYGNVRLGKSSVKLFKDFLNFKLWGVGVYTTLYIYMAPLVLIHFPISSIDRKFGYDFRILRKFPIGNFSCFSQAFIKFKFFPIGHTIRKKTIMSGKLSEDFDTTRGKTGKLSLRLKARLKLKMSNVDFNEIFTLLFDWADLIYFEKLINVYKNHISPRALVLYTWTNWLKKTLYTTRNWFILNYFFIKSIKQNLNIPSN